jgi:NAD(P)H-dependent FMN reductase
MSLKIVVLYGSVRTERKGIRAARFVSQEFAGRGHEVEFVDPVEYELPMLDRMYKEYDEGTAPEPMEKLAGLYRKADAFVVVSGEYNHGIPPALKNLVDHFMNEYFWRPAGIVSYSSGSFGGVRAAVQLRSVLAEVGMVTIPSALPVPRVGKAFDAEGRARDDAWGGRIERFIDELEWYARALARAREAGVPYS